MINKRSVFFSYIVVNSIKQKLFLGFDNFTSSVVVLLAIFPTYFRFEEEMLYITLMIKKGDKCTNTENKNTKAWSLKD